MVSPPRIQFQAIIVEPLFRVLNFYFSEGPIVRGWRGPKKIEEGLTLLISHFFETVKYLERETQDPTSKAGGRRHVSLATSRLFYARKSFPFLCTLQLS